mmetsp:Transcript_56996/g.139858  ORF Transcript_56996/g.139858 Transcript_56996/m.139858 type:complete len:210 (+) Transcript_56996:778-1407(+)
MPMSLMMTLTQSRVIFSTSPSSLGTLIMRSYSISSCVWSSSSSMSLYLSRKAASQSSSSSSSQKSSSLFSRSRLISKPGDTPSAMACTVNTTSVPNESQQSLHTSRCDTSLLMASAFSSALHLVKVTTVEHLVLLSMATLMFCQRTLSTCARLEASEVTNLLSGSFAFRTSSALAMARSDSAPRPSPGARSPARRAGAAPPMAGAACPG